MTTMVYDLRHERVCDEDDMDDVSRVQRKAAKRASRKAARKAARDVKAEARESSKGSAT